MQKRGGILHDVSVNKGVALLNGLLSLLTHFVILYIFQKNIYEYMKLIGSILTKKVYLWRYATC